jgi:hypothetical protein
VPPPGGLPSSPGVLAFSEHSALPIQVTHCVLPGLHRWTLVSTYYMPTGRMGTDEQDAGLKVFHVFPEV